MKKVFAIFAVSILCAAAPEKTYHVELNAQEWSIVLQVIDNSATPGEVRKPLINKIQSQLMSQDTVRPKPVQDTTIKKKSKP